MNRAKMKNMFKKDETREKRIARAIMKLERVLKSQ